MAGKSRVQNKSSIPSRKLVKLLGYYAEHKCYPIGVMATHTESLKPAELSTTSFTCDRCGLQKSYTGIGTGYARNDKDEKICYDCCAILDTEYMLEHGKIALYLDEKTVGHNGCLTKREVTNWPGTLRFPVHYATKGRHNIARTRTDVWFIGPNRTRWHGVIYGSDTQICHCKKLKD
jgi:hypothetical protein